MSSNAPAHLLYGRSLLCRRQDTLVQLSEIRVEPQSRDQAFEREEYNVHPLRGHPVGRKASLARRCVPDLSLTLLKGVLDFGCSENRSLLLEQ